MAYDSVVCGRVAPTATPHLFKTPPKFSNRATSPCKTLECVWIGDYLG